MSCGVLGLFPAPVCQRSVAGKDLGSRASLPGGVILQKPYPKTHFLRVAVSSCPLRARCAPLERRMNSVLITEYPREGGQALPVVFKGNQTHLS